HHAGSDDCAAAPRIREATKRNAKDGVEEHEAETHQQTHFRVTDAEITSNRSDQQVQNLAVDKRKHVGDREHRNHLTSVGTRGIQLFLERGSIRRHRTPVGGQSAFLSLQAQLGTGHGSLQPWWGLETEVCRESFLTVIPSGLPFCTHWPWEG